MGNKSSVIVPTISSNNKRFVLAIIDVQNDFLSGGSLAVPGANEVIAPINKLRFMYFDHMSTFVSQKSYVFWRNP